MAPEKISSKAVAQFTGTVFQNPNGDSKVRKSNLAKAKYWWLNREQFLDSIVQNGQERLTLCSSRRRGPGISRFSKKSKKGTRTQSSRVEAVFPRSLAR